MLSLVLTQQLAHSCPLGAASSEGQGSSREQSHWLCALSRGAQAGSELGGRAPGKASLKQQGENRPSLVSPPGCTLLLKGPALTPIPYPLSPPPHLREKLDLPVLQELLVLAAPR